MLLTLDETTLYFYNLSHTGSDSDAEKFRIERFNSWLTSYHETLPDNRRVGGTCCDSDSDLSFEEDHEAESQPVFPVSALPKYASGTSGYATQRPDIKDGKAPKRKAHEVDKNNNANDEYSGGGKNIKERRAVGDNPPPTFAEFMGLWKGKVLPTLIHYAAGYEYPWSFDKELVWRFLQPIIDHFIPKKRYVIDAPDKETLLDIAMQRLDEWRTSFGSTALAVLDTYFESENMNTAEERRKFARNVLRHNEFLFFDPAKVRDGIVPPPGTFHGLFVLHTFAAHFKSVVNAATYVPRLGEPTWAVGALGLAAAAVEWALSLWKKRFMQFTLTGDSVVFWQSEILVGRLAERAHGFNYKWSEQTWSYIDLARELPDDQFNLIMAEAQRVSNSKA